MAENANTATQQSKVAPSKSSDGGIAEVPTVVTLQDDSTSATVEWLCGKCKEPAEYIEEVPHCQNPSCSYFDSIIPNYREDV